MYRFEIVFTLLKHLRFFLIVPLLGIAAGLTAIASVPQIADVVTAVDFSSEEITMEQLDDLGTRTLIYDANGELVSALYTENRELLKLEDIPIEVVKTILVIEDEGFYDHQGISLRSILRATRETLRMGATQVKLMAGGGVASLYDPLESVGYSVEEFKAAVTAAEYYDTYVCIHAYNDKSVLNAMEAGVLDCVHGHLLSENVVKKMAQEGMWLSGLSKPPGVLEIPWFTEENRRKARTILEG